MKWAENYACVGPRDEPWYKAEGIMDNDKGERNGRATGEKNVKVSGMRVC